MSDIKKVEFKKIQEKKTATEKKHLPAIRIAIPLTESTRKFCPIFSWPSLVRKRYKKSNSKTSSSVNGSEEINNGHIAAGTEEDEDAGDVKRLARHFELKYGGSSTGKKKRSMFYNYSELATGYDESDSFIDNSDAFDEELPDEMDTFYGGYYVNSGVLQFKKLADKKEPRVEDVSDDEDVVPVKKRTIANVGDSGDEEDDDNNDMDTDSDDNYDDEEEEIDNDNAEENNENSVSSSEDSTDEKSDDEQNVSTERSDNEISDKLSVRSESKLEQKQNIIEENDNSVKSPVVNVENNEENYSQQLTTATLSLNGETKMKKSKKRHFSDNTIDLTFSKHKKKSLTVKSLLEEKRTQGTIDKVKEDAAVENESNNLLNKYNLPNETIVFNAVKQKKSNENNESNNSIGNDSKCSIELSSNVSISAVEKDSQHQQNLERIEVERNILAKSSNIMSDNKVIKLPDNLPSDVLRIIDEIITAASKHHVLDMGSRSFFSSSINEKLLSLEMKIRSNSSKTRQKLYHYLSLTVPCSKETLMKRAKKLIVDEEEKRMEEPCRKLTMAIASIMPVLIEKYTIECQQIAEQKDSSSDKKSQSSRMPQKKFTWNDETRSYLRELVLCRLRCFYIVKPRGESPEGYITKYLSSRLKPLWPQGWMRTSILLRESHVNDLLLKIKKGTSSAFTSPNKSSTVPTIVDDDNNANLSPTFNNALQRRNSSELQSQSAAGSAASNKEQTALLYESVVSSAASGVARKHDLSITSNSPLIGPSPDISTSLGLYSMLASMSNPQYGFTHNATYATTTANFDMLTSAAISSAYSSSTNNAIVTSKRQSVSPICAAGFNQVIAGKRQQSVSPIQISSTPSVQRNQSISPVYSSASTGVQQPKKPPAQHSPISSSINHSAKPSSSVSPVYSHPSLPVLCQTLQTTSPSSGSSPSSVDKRETASPNDNPYKVDHLIAASTSSAVSTSSSCSTSKVKAKDSVAQHLPKYRKQSAIANKTEAPSKPQPVPTHCEEVLDLSPNKIPKSVESHDDTQSPNEKITDRNYWPSGKKTEESSYLVPPPEAKSDKLQYVQPFVVPKETTGSSVTHHLNRKQRLLQDSIVSSQSAREVQETAFPSFSVIKTDEKSGENDMRMIEETATATDVISQIINDTLQDNSTPLQPQFNRFNFENKYLKNEIIPVEEKYKNLNKTEKMKKEIYSSSSSAYVAKERSREDSAIVEAAEVIKDLQMLNRIGRTISKSNFTDSSPIHSVVSNSSNNYNNPNVGSMHPDIRIPNSSNSSSAAAATAPYFQSSLRVSSSADNTSDIPRMSISGFQNEYFKHIFKSERNKDDVTSGSIKKHNEYAYNKKDRSQIENCRTDRSNHYPLANIPAAQNVPENSLYIPQQSVIVPTLNSSSQWRTTTDSNM